MLRARICVPIWHAKPNHVGIESRAARATVKLLTLSSSSLGVNSDSFYP